MGQRHCYKKIAAKIDALKEKIKQKNELPEVEKNRKEVRYERETRKMNVTKTEY